MKKIIPAAVAVLVGISLAAFAGDKKKGDKCVADIECAFGLTCADGACVNKKEFDFGSSGKSGKSCNNDADCIGSGKCVEGTFGKKVCSGN
jgi:hypothetical protein